MDKIPEVGEHTDATLSLRCLARSEHAAHRAAENDVEITLADGVGEGAVPTRRHQP
jgi:hypothetical protein